MRCTQVSRFSIKSELCSFSLNAFFFSFILFIFVQRVFGPLLWIVTGDKRWIYGNIRNITLIDLFISNTNWMVFLGLFFFSSSLPVTLWNCVGESKHRHVYIYSCDSPTAHSIYHFSLFSEFFRLDCHNLDYCSQGKFSIKCQLTVGLLELFPNCGLSLPAASFQISLYALAISLSIWMIIKKKYFTNITHGRKYGINFPSLG